jgi:hypothetical protein
MVLIVWNVIGSLSINAQAIPVRLLQSEGKWVITRGGELYDIRGVGGQHFLDEAVNMGANSIRTWSLEHAKKYLDEAHKRGLTVMMGLWVQHERHGFDYDDTVAVKKQLLYFTEKVKEIKDHPALLLWGIGNEVDLFYSNTKVWDAIQDIAQMIHELDPNHPTCTVTAGLDSTEVRLIKSQAPDIDILGINTYGDVNHVVDHIADYGWNRPYIIAEWGPNGHWEVAKRAWGAPIEQNSSQKAQSYKERYAKILTDSVNSMGSYLFLWGAKQETTSTWYGVFSEFGERTEVLDVMHEYWKGNPASNRCPVFLGYQLERDGLSVKSYVLAGRQEYGLKVIFTDPDSDRLRYRFSIVEESRDIKSGGDAETAPPSVPGLIKRKKGAHVYFKTPETEGAYRIFVYAADGKGNVGYCNIPFYVLPSDKVPHVRLKKRQLDVNKGGMHDI